jgi:hypothetical protein
MSSPPVATGPSPSISSAPSLPNSMSLPRPPSMSSGPGPPFTVSIPASPLISAVPGSREEIVIVSVPSLRVAENGLAGATQVTLLPLSVHCEFGCTPMFVSPIV